MYSETSIEIGAPEASTIGFFDYALLGTFIMICSLISAILSIFILILANKNIIKMIAEENISTTKERRSARKQERAAARAAKAVEDKQKRIDELQAEIKELSDDSNKKD